MASIKVKIEKYISATCQRRNVLKNNREEKIKLVHLLRIFLPDDIKLFAGDGWAFPHREHEQCQ